MLFNSNHKNNRNTHIAGRGSKVVPFHTVQPSMQCSPDSHVHGRSKVVPRHMAQSGGVRYASKYASGHTQGYARKRLLPLALAFLLGAGAILLPDSAIRARADKVSDLEAQTQETQSELSAAASSQAALESEQTKVQESIDYTNAVLVQNMASISMLQSEIDDLDTQIQQKQEEYDAAKAEEDKQYEAMKKRIQFMYEQGDISYLQILAKASSFSDLVNKADYVSQLYEYDRNMLQKFQDIQKDVKEKQEALEADKDERETSMNEMQVEQDALQTQLSSLQAQYDDFETRIEQAQSQAVTLAARLRQQNSDLKEAQAAKAKAEAEAKAAAEAAAKAEAEAKAAADAKARAEAEAKAQAAREAEEKAKAEAEAAAKAVAEAQAAQVSLTTEATQTTTTDTGSSGDSGNTSATDTDTNTDTGSTDGTGETAETAEASQTSDTGASSVASGSSTSSGTTTSGVSGQDIVNFASQFVGNPYVYGGTSLTDGADCSGFTQSVFRNFGIYIGRTDVDQRSAGVAVASLADAQPGDLICYPGHVAIYCGNNTIVHASTAATGIKFSNADYRAYVCIRRLVS